MKRSQFYCNRVLKKHQMEMCWKAHQKTIRQIIDKKPNPPLSTAKSVPRIRRGDREVIKNNRILMERIMYQTTKHKHVPSFEKPSKGEKRNQSLQQQNLQMVKRILKVKSQYSLQNLEKHINNIKTKRNLNCAKYKSTSAAFNFSNKNSPNKVLQVGVIPKEENLIKKLNDGSLAHIKIKISENRVWLVVFPHEQPHQRFKVQFTFAQYNHILRTVFNNSFQNLVNSITFNQQNNIVFTLQKSKNMTPAVPALSSIQYIAMPQVKPSAIRKIIRTNSNFPKEDFLLKVDQIPLQKVQIIPIKSTVRIDSLNASVT